MSAYTCARTFASSFVWIGAHRPSRNCVGLLPRNRNCKDLSFNSRCRSEASQEPKTLLIGLFAFLLLSVLVLCRPSQTLQERWCRGLGNDQVRDATHWGRNVRQGKGAKRCTCVFLCFYRIENTYSEVFFCQCFNPKKTCFIFRFGRCF